MNGNGNVAPPRCAPYAGSVASAGEVPFRAALTWAYFQTGVDALGAVERAEMREPTGQDVYWTSNRRVRHWDAPPSFRAAATHRYKFRGCPKWASNEKEVDISRRRDGHTGRSGATRDDPSKGELKAARDEALGPNGSAKGSLGAVFNAAKQVLGSTDQLGENPSQFSAGVLAELVVPEMSVRQELEANPRPRSRLALFCVRFGCDRVEDRLQESR